MNPKCCASTSGRTVMLRRQKDRQVSEMMDWRNIRKQMPGRKKFPLPCIPFRFIYSISSMIPISLPIVPFLVLFLKTALEASVPEQR